jgi:hypothetical protein
MAKLFVYFQDELKCDSDLAERDFSRALECHRSASKLQSPLEKSDR